MKNIVTLLTLAFLTACAGPAPLVDNSDKNPTAVIASKSAISGFVLPDATTTEVVYSRNDRRLTTTQRKYDSWMARQFFGNTSEATILRMDRDLRWVMIDNDGDKTYTECPLAGCANAGMERFKALQKKEEKQGKTGAQSFDYDPNDKAASACPISLTQNTFKVSSTGKTRQIAGQLSKQYHANWVVEYKDEKGRADKNHLKMVFWNAQPSAEMEKAWAMSAQADQAYLEKLKQDENALTMVIPDEILSTLTVFAGDLVSNNKWAKNMAKEMAKAKGHPMSTTVEWYLDRKACFEPQQAKKKTGFDWMNPMDAIAQTASDMAGKKAAEMFIPNPNEAIFRYTNEITSIGIKYEHDSRFTVPAGYKRVNNKP